VELVGAGDCVHGDLGGAAAVGARRIMQLLAGASVQSAPSGPVMAAASACRRYSCAVPRPIEQLWAGAETSNGENPTSHEHSTSFWVDLTSFVIGLTASHSIMLEGRRRLAVFASWLLDDSAKALSRYSSAKNCPDTVKWIELWSL
jgi:hypothetical protein